MASGWESALRTVPGDGVGVWELWVGERHTVVMAEAHKGAGPGFLQDLRRLPSAWAGTAWELGGQLSREKLRQRKTCKSAKPWLVNTTAEDKGVIQHSSNFVVLQAYDLLALSRHKWNAKHQEDFCIGPLLLSRFTTITWSMWKDGRYYPQATVKIYQPFRYFEKLTYLGNR